MEWDKTVDPFEECTRTENNDEINNAFHDEVAIEDLMEIADFDDLNLNFGSVIEEDCKVLRQMKDILEKKARKGIPTMT